MGSIWLPVKAIRTPYWFSVALACVNFFARELSKERWDFIFSKWPRLTCICNTEWFAILFGYIAVKIAGLYFPDSISCAFHLRFLLTLRIPLGTPGNVSRIEDNRADQAEIGNSYEKQQDRVTNNNPDRSSITRLLKQELRAKEILDYRIKSAWCSQIRSLLLKTDRIQVLSQRSWRTLQCPRW